MVEGLEYSSVAFFFVVDAKCGQQLDHLFSLGPLTAAES